MVKKNIKKKRQGRLTVNSQPGGACGLAHTVDGHTGIDTSVKRLGLVDDHCVDIVSLDELPARGLWEWVALLCAEQERL